MSLKATIGALRVVLGMDSAAFEKGTSKAERRMNRMKRTFSRVSGKMQSIGVGMAQATAPIAVGFGAALRAAGNFEEEMNTVAALSGATESELKSLSDMALDLGKNTKFGANEAAGAINMLLRNGLQVDEVLGGALDSTLLLSSALKADLSGSADLLTDVMAQFGITAEDTTHVVNQLAGAAQTSKLDFQGLMLGFANAGGAAAASGVEFEDFTASLAAIMPLFASGSDAGTSFKTFVQRLVPASDAAADAMQRLGLEFFDAQGNMKGMEQIAEELKQGLEGLSDAEKNDALATIFGTDAIRTAIALGNEGAEGIRKYKEAIGNTDAEQMAKTQNQGLNAAMRSLSSALEGLALAFAQSGVIDAVTQVIERITEFVRKLSETNPEILKWTGILGAIAVAAGPVIIALGAVVGAIGPLVAGLGLIAGPVGLVVAAFAGLVAAGVTVYRNWDEIKNWASKTWTAVRDTITGAAKTASDAVIGIFTNLIPSLVGIGRDLLSGLMQGIKDRVAAVMSGISDIATGIKNRFKGLLGIRSPSRVFRVFGQAIMQGLGLGLRDTANEPLAAISDVADGLQTSLPDALDVAGDGFDRLGDRASDTFKTIGKDLAGIIKGTGSFKGLLSNVLRSAQKGFGDLAMQGITKNMGSGLMGTLATGLIGGLMGFQYGGQFEVGGAGGIDSQLVAFRATPDETVTITRPGQDMAPHGGLTYAPTIHVGEGADPAMVAKLRAELDRQRAEIPAIAQRAVIDGRNRGIIE